MVHQFKSVPLRIDSTRVNGSETNVAASKETTDTSNN